MFSKGFNMNLLLESLKFTSTVFYIKQNTAASLPQITISHFFLPISHLFGHLFTITYPIPVFMAQNSSQAHK